MNRHRRSHSPSPPARRRQPSPHQLVKLAVVEILQRFRQVARQRQAWLAIALMSATPRDRSVAHPIRPNRHRIPLERPRLLPDAGPPRAPKENFKRDYVERNRSRNSSAKVGRSPASHRKASVTRRLFRQHHKLQTQVHNRHLRPRHRTAPSPNNPWLNVSPMSPNRCYLCLKSIQFRGGGGGGHRGAFRDWWRVNQRQNDKMQLTHMVN